MSGVIRADESMKAQSKVEEKGNWTFIDKIKVRLVDSDYWADVNNFGSKFVHIQTQYVIWPMGHSCTGRSP